jgi:hypothetical protein
VLKSLKLVSVRSISRLSEKADSRYAIGQSVCGKEGCRAETVGIVFTPPDFVGPVCVLLGGLLLPSNSPSQPPAGPVSSNERRGSTRLMGQSCACTDSFSPRFVKPEIQAGRRVERRGGRRRRGSEIKFGTSAETVFALIFFLTACLRAGQHRILKARVLGSSGAWGGTRSFSSGVYWEARVKLTVTGSSIPSPKSSSMGFYG